MTATFILISSALKAGIKTLDVLSDLLKDSIILYLERPETENPEEAKPVDLSYIWRPAIEDHVQNHKTSIMNSLVEGIRDSSKLIIEDNKDTFNEVIKKLESNEWYIFQRIALHIIRNYPDINKDIIVENLTES